MKILMIYLFILMSVTAKAQSYSLHLETRREPNNAYQKDKAKYGLTINQMKQLLSVRASQHLKQVISSTPVIIVNRGKAEALTTGNTIYFDMALLDLLFHFADEFSLAEVKNDNYHILEFNLTYAVALNGGKILELLPAYNTLNYSEEQKSYLWNNKLIAQEVIFNQILGFILAHEISHVALNHEKKIQKEFPHEGERRVENARWNRRRREVELEADRLAAHLCLNALIQPAQLLPWLDLNEIRRRYYGTSAEYPTSAQRISVIDRVYEELINEDKMLGDMNEFKPLPPHRDLFQGDYHMFLDEFQKVRKYRQTLLIGIDQSVVPLIQKNYPLDQVAASFIVIVEQQKDLLNGADNKEVIQELIDMIPTEVVSSYDPTQMISRLNSAGIGPYALAMLTDILKEKEIDWKQFEGNLSLLYKPAKQFLDGISYDYLLTNSALRWYPDAFSTLQEMLPANEIKARNLKPFQIGHPIRNSLPTFDKRIKILKSWDGKY